jgi:bifunctional DNA-binding transcriptional regulator/antitoxin component of YhaV-PrlF toxin-antitoxin module
MQQVVSITNQGQITLPAAIRRLFSLDKFKKVLVRAQTNQIIVEPMPDFSKMAGILKNKKIKKPIQEVIKLEEKAIETIRR